MLPSTTPVFVSVSEPAARAIPKSTTLTRPSGSSITFPGLMSRWIRPRSCAAASARAMSTATATRLGLRHRTVAPEPVGERLALDELGHDVVGAVVRPAVEHGDDVRVAQPGRGAGLALEPLDELTVAVERGREDLDRHLASELAVEPLVDLGHAALAEHRPELVAVDEDVVRGLLHEPRFTHGPPPLRLSHRECPQPAPPPVPPPPPPPPPENPPPENPLDELDEPNPPLEDPLLALAIETRTSAGAADWKCCHAVSPARPVGAPRIGDRRLSTGTSALTCFSTSSATPSATAHSRYCSQMTTASAGAFGRSEKSLR